MPILDGFKRHLHEMTTENSDERLVKRYQRLIHLILIEESKNLKAFESTSVSYSR